MLNRCFKWLTLLYKGRNYQHGKTKITWACNVCGLNWKAQTLILNFVLWWLFLIHTEFLSVSLLLLKETGVHWVTATPRATGSTSPISSSADAKCGEENHSEANHNLCTIYAKHLTCLLNEAMSFGPNLRCYKIISSRCWKKLNKK